MRLLVVIGRNNCSYLPQLNDESMILDGKAFVTLLFSPLVNMLSASPTTNRMNFLRRITEASLFIALSLIYFNSVIFKLYGDLDSKCLVYNFSFIVQVNL